MQASDLEAGLRLTQAERWSHRLADWEFSYRLGQGWVACDPEGNVVGTALWWAYGERFGTVGLIVVDRRHQGKGIGRQLMNTLMQDAGVRTLQLVATSAGMKLYQQCGFREQFLISQRQGVPHVRVVTPPPSGTSLRAVSPADLAALCELDASAMGAPRRHVIAAVLEAGSGVLAERDGQLTGFALERESGRGTLVGPVVAGNEALAVSLISYLLEKSSGFARVDIHSDATQLAGWLDAAGLRCVDQVTTMVRGETPERGSAVRIFGLVSQALS
jgi:GNAT superfamily N-acetyltransferase